jgi:hypothetical protein
MIKILIFRGYLKIDVTMYQIKSEFTISGVGETVFVLL